MRPRDEAELAVMIAEAGQPLQITGGGTRGQPGGQADARHLFTDGLSGISLYDPGAMTLVVKAGTSLAETQHVLDSHGQRLEFEPPDHCRVLGRKGVSTIGGVVASNASGPRRVQAGAARDFVIGARFVDGMGNIIKNGGRVMKNVTGLDLARLMAGSRGELGVLTEISFKVMPSSGHELTLALSGLTDQRAVQAMARAMASSCRVTGAAHRPDRQQTLLRLEGSGASVAERSAKLRGLLAEFGNAEQLPGGEWAGLRDLTPFADRPGTIWRILVKASDSAGLVAAIRRQVPQAEALYDWAGSLVWLLVAGLGDGDGGRGALRSALQQLRYGHATVFRAGPALAGRHGETARTDPVREKLAQGLRRSFDPRQIFAEAGAA